jgi:hypothetical protein
LKRLLLRYANEGGCIPLPGPHGLGGETVGSDVRRNSILMFVNGVSF